ncbi:MAG: hypothetical protein EOM67_15560 [Spirochaetia bacterium]|nr:hypothetical protein [Spirochaetia bacterium]
MTLREKIEVMEAFERGEEIEVSDYGYEEWRTVNDPFWKWNVNKYHIKPKPKQVIVIEKWLCMSGWGNYFIIEGGKAFFETGGYDRQQVKLLSTREVEID